MNDYRELHELYHFGILGMHWGVRRYQNPDGTLTAAGKKRLKQGDKVLNKVASSKAMNKMSSKMTDHVVNKMQEKSFKEDEEFNGSGQRWGRRKDYKNSDGTLNETGKERLRSLNEDYAYYQHIKKSMEDSERLMSGNLSDEESEYLSPSQKAFMNYISKSPTFNALYKVSNNMSKPIMEQYKSNVDSKLKEFEDRGITLKEIDKMRPLYMNNEYVKKVFKQFELSDELKHFGILGMHWGVRRYQNPDGTLTEAGKKRYYKEEVKKANNQIDQEKRGISSYELSKTDYIKEAIKDLGGIDENGFAKVNYKEADIEELAKKLTSNKLGMYVNGEKNLTKDALYEALKTKYAEEKENLPDDVKQRHEKYVQDKATLTGVDMFSEQDSYKNPERANKAADLGLKALNKIGRDGYDEKEGITQGDRDWFVWEDQTIGMATVADLVLQGKSKEDIKKLIKASHDIYFDTDDKDREKKGVFQLAEGYIGDDYIDALFAILESEGKIHHSAVDKIFEKFGII